MTQPFYSPEYHSALDKLRTFGLARDRVADRTPRQVVLTDDEAVSVLDVLSQHDVLAKYGEVPTP